MAPQEWNGSNFVYSRVIRPYLLRYEEKIDQTLGKAGKLGKQALNEGKSILAFAVAGALL